jgi:hypothetical protein
LGGITRTVNKNTEALIAASKQIGIAANGEEAKHIVMSCDQHIAQNHNITTVHKSSERVKQVSYLGTEPTDQNFILKEIKSRLNSVNAWYRSVQNLLSLC